MQARASWGNDDSIFTCIAVIVLNQKEIRPQEKPVECIHSMHTGSFNEENELDPPGLCVYVQWFVEGIWGL